MNPKLLLGLALVLGTGAANGQNPPRDEIPHEVLAFYYPWYSVDRSGTHGRHWGVINAAAHETSATAHYPARGVYNSMDPAVVKSQMQLAKSNDITGFIVSWKGWLEGTEIKPSVEFGDKYLKLTAEYAGRFLHDKP